MGTHRMRKKRWKITRNWMTSIFLRIMYVLLTFFHYILFLCVSFFNSVSQSVCIRDEHWNGNQNRWMHKIVRFLCSLLRQMLQIVPSAQISLNFRKNLLSEIISHITILAVIYLVESSSMCRQRTQHSPSNTPADMCQTKKCQKHRPWITVNGEFFKDVCFINVWPHLQLVMSLMQFSNVQLIRWERFQGRFFTVLSLLHCLSSSLRPAYILRATMQKQSSEVFLDSHHFFNCHQNKNAPRTGQ